MKYTLLELVQAIASSMDSDEVNSINDSVESLQIATVVRTAYFDLVSRLSLPEHYALFNLNASGDNTKPVLMTLPSDVKSVKWLKYDKQTSTDTDINYQEVKYLPLRQFLDMTQNFDVDETNIDSMTAASNNGSTFTFYYYNDRAPTYYTTLDDFTVFFDSFDNAVDTTLQSSKTMAYGLKTATWEMSNSFTPDLDEEMFSLLLNEAKALAWAELKQSAHQKAEQSARRMWVRTQRAQDNFRELTDFEKLPDFGRK